MLQIKSLSFPMDLMAASKGRDTSAAAKIREELGIDHDIPMVSMIDVWIHKKTMLVFYAMRNIPDALPDTNFCFAGLDVTIDNPAIGKMIQKITSIRKDCICSVNAITLTPL